MPVFQIRDVLVQIRIWISGCGAGSGFVEMITDPDLDPGGPDTYGPQGSGTLI
jgi:hypothetical protein